MTTKLTEREWNDAAEFALPKIRRAIGWLAGDMFDADREQLREVAASVLAKLDATKHQWDDELHPAGCVGKYP